MPKEEYSKKRIMTKKTRNQNRQVNREQNHCQKLNNNNFLKHYHKQNQNQ